MYQSRRQQDLSRSFGLVAAQERLFGSKPSLNALSNNNSLVLGGHHPSKQYAHQSSSVQQLPVRLANQLPADLQHLDNVKKEQVDFLSQDLQLLPALQRNQPQQRLQDFNEQEGTLFYDHLQRSRSNLAGVKTSHYPGPMKSIIPSEKNTTPLQSLGHKMGRNLNRKEAKNSTSTRNFNQKPQKDQQKPKFRQKLQILASKNASNAQNYQNRGYFNNEEALAPQSRQEYQDEAVVVTYAAQNDAQKQNQHDRMESKNTYSSAEFNPETGITHETINDQNASINFDENIKQAEQLPMVKMTRDTSKRSFNVNVGKSSRYANALEHVKAPRNQNQISAVQERKQMQRQLLKVKSEINLQKMELPGGIRFKGDRIIEGKESRRNKEVAALSRSILDLASKTDNQPSNSNKYELNSQILHQSRNVPLKSSINVRKSAQTFTINQDDNPQMSSINLRSYQNRAFNAQTNSNSRRHLNGKTSLQTLKSQKFRRTPRAEEYNPIKPKVKHNLAPNRSQLSKSNKVSYSGSPTSQKSTKDGHSKTLFHSQSSDLVNQQAERNLSKINQSKLRKNSPNKEKQSKDKQFSKQQHKSKLTQLRGSSSSPLNAYGGSEEIDNKYNKNQGLSRQSSKLSLKRFNSQTPDSKNLPIKRYNNSQDQLEIQVPQTSQVWQQDLENQGEIQTKKKIHSGYRPAFDQHLSKSTKQYNRSLQTQQNKLNNVIQGADFQELETIKNTDTHQMLADAAKNLKIMSYNLSRCVQSGLDHFISLKVTTSETSKDYYNQMNQQKGGALKGNNPQQEQNQEKILCPSTRLEIVDQNPIQAHLFGDNRRGYVRMVVRGKIPGDFNILISETFPDPNPENATWNLTRPRVVNLLPSDSKKNDNKKIKGPKVNAQTLNKTFCFTNLYFKILSREDCKFMIEITFPEEEDFQRRRKILEKHGIGPRDAKDAYTVDYAKEAHEKKIQQVTELVEDEEQAKKFFGDLKAIKSSRRVRQLTNAQSSPRSFSQGLDENHEEQEVRVQEEKIVDFVKLNKDGMPQRSPNSRKIEIQKHQQEYNQRLEFAKEKRKHLLEEKTKYNILQMARWDLLKARKAEQIEQINLEKRQKFYKLVWTRRLMTQHILQRVNSIFVENREAYYLAIKKDHMAQKIQGFWKFANQYRLQANGKAESRLVRNSLTLAVFSTFESSQLESSKVLEKFLLKVSFNMRLKRHIIDFTNKINLIARKWRFNQNHFVKVQSQMIFLQGREREAMEKYALSKHKDKKMKLLVEKLNNSSKNLEARKGLVSEYLNICKLVHNLQAHLALIWRKSTNYLQMRDSLILDNLVDSKVTRIETKLKQIFRGTSGRLDPIGQVFDAGNLNTQMVTTKKQRTMKKMLTVVTTATNASTYAKTVKTKETDTLNYALRALALVKLVKDSKFVGILQQLQAGDQKVATITIERLEKSTGKTDEIFKECLVSLVQRVDKQRIQDQQLRRRMSKMSLEGSLKFEEGFSQYNDGSGGMSTRRDFHRDSEVGESPSRDQQAQNYASNRSAVSPSTKGGATTTAKSPKKQKKKKVEKNELLELFPLSKNVSDLAKKQLILAFLRNLLSDSFRKDSHRSQDEFDEIDQHGEITDPHKLKTINFAKLFEIPAIKYVPSRATMQRLIHRSFALPHNFSTFENLEAIESQNRLTEEDQDVVGVQSPTFEIAKL